MQQHTHTHYNTTKKGGECAENVGNLIRPTNEVLLLFAAIVGCVWIYIRRQEDCCRQQEGLSKTRESHKLDSHCLLLLFNILS